MLTQKSLNASYSIAEMAAAHSLLLTPISGTPLDVLVNLCETPRITIVPSTPDEPVASGEVSLMDASLQQDVLGGVPHNDAMDEYVDVISRTIAHNLDVARNIATPMIEAVVKHATELADSHSGSMLSPLNVVPYHYPNIYNNPIFLEMLNKYSESPVEDMSLSLVIPNQPTDIIRSYVNTGVSRLDDDVVQLVDRTGGEDGLVGLWNALFGTSVGGPTPKLTDFLSMQPGNAGRMALLFLMANRLREEIPEGLNMDISAYRLYMATIMEQAGRAASSIVRVRNQNARTKKLVLGTPLKRRDDTHVGDITVNGDIYGKWLKEGGTPEVLFGAVRQDRGSSTYDELIAGREGFADTWKKAFSLLSVKAQYERFNHFIDGLRVAMQLQIKNLPEELRFVDEALYRDRLSKHLTDIHDAGIDKPWNSGRKLVCRVFFPQMDIEKILREIEQHMELNPDMNPREAALMATIDIVSDWIAHQWKVDYVRDMKSSGS